jgi:hypothetical protein
MTAVGVVLLMVGVSAGPDGVSVGGPRLTRGDELHYTGDVQEAGDRLGNRFRKRHALEVRLFVLDATRESADCALLTVVRPLPDPTVASAAEAIGAARVKEVAAPSVRLELIRVDGRGRVRLLRPAAGPPPLPLESADTAAPPPFPLDLPPATELGLFVPFPAASVKLHTTWDSVEAERPPIGWKAVAETVWNGGRGLELTAVQQSTGYDQPDTVPSGWKRTESAIVSPADGYASTVTRTVVRREGRDTVGSVKVTYEQQPRNRATGVKYAAIRREIETAWVLAEELKELQSPGKRTPPDEFRTRAAKVEQYLADNPADSAFRPAIEAARRRFEAAAAGIAPPVAAIVRVANAGPPAIGSLLDDFVLADVARPSGQFRFSGARGVPVLLVAYRPNAITSKGTVKLASALREKYGDLVRVVPVAVFDTPDKAADERKELKLELPIYDGRTLEKPLGIDSWPVFLIADGTGKLRWRFDAGLGKETGYLIGKELDELLKKPGR